MKKMKALTLILILILAQVFTNASCQKEKPTSSNSASTSSNSIAISNDTVYYPFIKENAYWKVRYATRGSGSSFNYVTMHGDTIINALKYKVLYTSKDSSFNFNDSSKWGLVLREREKKVYLFDLRDSRERLLYDFSLKMGSLILDQSGYQWGVINIDSILIGNNYRKRWRFKGPESDIWIEGIGSTFGIIFPFTISSLESLSNLECYKEKNIVECNFSRR